MKTLRRHLRSSASFAGKNQPVVLITGASQGIGAALARTFAEHAPGVRLVLVARNLRKLQAVATACQRLGASVAEPLVCDVTDEVAVARLAVAVQRRFRHVDALINNAGAFAPAPLLETTPAQFDRMLDVNLRSTFLVSRAFLPGMVQRKRGDIFNISSIAGLQAYPAGAAYCAAKFGLTGLTQVMRTELKDKGIRVCAVHPGGTWTDSWRGSGVKPQRLMPAADVARAVFDAWRLGPRTVVEEIILRPQLGDV